MIWIAIPITLVGIILFVIYFNRDPKRKIPKGNVIISPANGKLMSIEKSDGKYNLAIFMNPFNIHIQRAPYSGTVLSVKRIDGPNLPAFLEDSKHNKKVITTFDTAIGDIIVKQLTGVAVRRIINKLKKGQKLKTGDTIGKITLGSRVDLVFPSSRARLKVKEGQDVIDGETVIATLSR